MPLIELTEVCCAPADPNLVSGANLDNLATCSTFENYCLPLIGWVVGAEAAVSRIRIYLGFTCLAEVPVTGLREDVAVAYPGLSWSGLSGFATAVSLLGLPATFQLTVRAVFKYGEMCTIGRISGRRQPLRSDYQPRFQPLLVTSLGRMGTTWLMRILVEHPEIVSFRGEFNPEYNLGRYWVHLLKVLTAPGNYMTSPYALQFFDDLQRIGPNPYYDRPLTDAPPVHYWMSVEYPREVARFCQASIDGVYARIAEHQNQPRARFFAEKTLATHLPRLTGELYAGAREVFLVRDFRDMLCSILAYNARRGIQGFGRDGAATDEEYIAFLSLVTEQLLNSWEERRSRAHLVRYEDLANAPAATIAALFEYLGVERSPELVEQILAATTAETTDLQAHRTTRDLGSSIGRWRQDLPAQWQTICAHSFRQALLGFGYPL